MEALVILMITYAAYFWDTIRDAREWKDEERDTEGYN